VGTNFTALAGDALHKCAALYAGRGCESMDATGLQAPIPSFLGCSVYGWPLLASASTSFR
jgi:hypothetical protein